MGQREVMEGKGWGREETLQNIHNKGAITHLASRAGRGGRKVWASSQYGEAAELLGS